MKRSLLFVALLWALALTAQAQATTIYVDNQSPFVTDEAFNATVKAIQIQLDTELEPAWGSTATLVVGEAPEGAWRVTVEDGDTPYLGYHDFNFHPFARVFMVEPTKYNWQVTLGHELQEMIVDPWVDRLVRADRLWLVEISDPVEADRFGQWTSVDGYPVLLSDFVLPGWYQGSCPCDIYGHVQYAGQVLKEGYAVYWEDEMWKFLYPKGGKSGRSKHD